MSFDTDTQSHNNYFWISISFIFLVMSFLCVAALYIAREQVMGSLGQLSVIQALQQGQRYESWVCESDSYVADRFYRRVANDGVQTPAEYVPVNLTTLDPALVHPRVGRVSVEARVEAPLTRMVFAGRAEGHNLRVNSAYRSFNKQQEIFDLANPNDIITKPEIAARPGFSEHQLGVAVDLSGFPNNDLPSYAWLDSHAWEYGFVKSYPEEEEHVTGFGHEPWHWRYVGKPLANYLRENDILFNEQDGLLLPYENSELSYGYKGNNIHVWKSQGSGLESLITGFQENIPEIDVQYLLQKIDQGITGEERVTTPGAIFVTNKVNDLEGSQDWVSFVTRDKNDTIEQLEVVTVPHAGYLVINHQDPGNRTELVREVLNICQR